MGAGADAGPAPSSPSPSSRRRRLCRLEDEQERAGQGGARKAPSLAQEQAQAAVRRAADLARRCAIDAVRIEIGYALLPMINDDAARAAPRRPGPRAAPPDGDRFRLRAALGPRSSTIWASSPANMSSRSRRPRRRAARSSSTKLLLINPGGGPVGLPGENTTEPVFGLPALWIDRELRDEAGFRGLTVVDCGTIITTHLTELVEGQHRRPALLHRDAEAADRSPQAIRRSWSPTSSRPGLDLERPAHPAEPVDAKASRSATSRRSSKASPKPHR